VAQDRPLTGMVIRGKRRDRDSGDCNDESLWEAEGDLATLKLAFHASGDADRITKDVNPIEWF